MDDKKVFSRNKNIVSRDIAGEMVLLPILKTNQEMNCIYTLNKSASWVWERIDGRRSLARIKKEALEVFDASDAEMEQEMEKLIKDLVGIRAVV